MPDGFISHFYSVSEHVSPVLAFGFLGPKPQLAEVCAFFKVNRGRGPPGLLGAWECLAGARPTWVCSKHGVGCGAYGRAGAPVAREGLGAVWRDLDLEGLCGGAGAQSPA